ncbi:MAG: MBL fold metallo-hydrolase, partial [Granulosicoccus sp.]
MALGELQYESERQPDPGEGIDICAGIRWYRVPLPFALDHVNCWLLHAAGEDRVLIDTGVDSPQTRSIWQDVFTQDSSTGGGNAPVFTAPEQLLVTHFHPDHMGLASWFAAKGSALKGSAVEVRLAGELYAIDDDDYASAQGQWYRAGGLPVSSIDVVLASGNTYAAKVSEPPAQQQWEMLETGQVLTLAGQQYRVITGQGHSPDMILLYRDSDRVLIAADQVLPGITPNVSVMLHSRRYDLNPLQSFMECLTQLRKLPEDTLVLPSHGLPFRGLRARIDVLLEHHEVRLNQVLD